jgi:hypothetical protein
MIRQRVSLHTPVLGHVARLLTVLLGLALLWYGLMVVLLAVKVAPHTVNAISAYRTLYHDAASLTSADFTTERRLIAGVAGLLAFALCLYLALQQIPRPRLARTAMTIGDRDRGDTSVVPRAVERVAEIAAMAHRQVSSVRSRLGEDSLDVLVHVRSAREAAGTLRDVQRRVSTALEQHGLPVGSVNVTLTGYHRTTTRELA